MISNLDGCKNAGYIVGGAPSILKNIQADLTICVYCNHAKAGGLGKWKSVFILTQDMLCNELPMMLVFSTYACKYSYRWDGKYWKQT